MQIEGRRIGQGEPCFIVAEAGTAHEGNLERAFFLVDAAKDAGADCVKFQTVFADEIIHPLTGKVKLPGGDIPLYERFKGLEQDKSFYQQIKDYTEKRGLIFLCTPFGVKSARLLRDIGVSVLKIASPELNHFPLLKEVAEYNLPFVLSTGVSTLGDIEKALLTIGGTRSGLEDADLSDIELNKGNIALLHCITSYPAPEEEYNLKLIKTLNAVFGIPVGVSDHSLDPLLVPVVSVLMGACIIEKHFKAFPRLREQGAAGEGEGEEAGLDTSFALAPEEFSEMVTGVREVERTGQEYGCKWMRDKFGAEKVAKVVGDGVKKLAYSEKENYETTRRSLHAVQEIKAGRVFSRENVAILRSEKNLRPGLSPAFFELLLGKKVKKTVKAGEGILWENVF